MPCAKFEVLKIYTERVIGASRSEPHTNQYYEKITVRMYVCIYVCSDHARACVIYSSRARAVNIAAHVNQQHRPRRTTLASFPGSGDEASDGLAAKMVKE